MNANGKPAIREPGSRLPGTTTAGAPMGSTTPAPPQGGASHTSERAESANRVHPLPREGGRGEGSPLTAVILAGGLGRRVEGADKGLLLFRGKPLVQWVLDRIEPQVQETLLNANRNREVYASFGVRVIGDQIADHPGPLAGLHAGLVEAENEWVLSLPCDAPFLPLNLAQRLGAVRGKPGVRAAIACCQGRQHPVFALCHRDQADRLEAYLREGGRRVGAWFTLIEAVEVPFDDQPEAFQNLNTQSAIDACGSGSVETIGRAR